MTLIQWPLKSSDLPPCDFFLWEYIKDKVFIPPFSVDLAELKQCIIATVDEIDSNTLTCVWEEMVY